MEIEIGIDGKKCLNKLEIRGRKCLEVRHVGKSVRLGEKKRKNL